MKIRPHGGHQRVHVGELTPGHAARFVCGHWAVNFDVVGPRTNVTCQLCLRRLNGERIRGRGATGDGDGSTR